MPETARRIIRARRGVATIKVLLALPAATMFAWLGIEVALVLRAAAQAKTAADAIALAAAARFADGPEVAREDALVAAAASPGPNGPIAVTIPVGAGGGGDVFFGDWDEDSRAFSTSADGGPAARATVRLGEGSPNGAPGIVLAGLFELAGVSLERTSVAVYTPPKHATSLHLLGTGAANLELTISATCVARNGIALLSTDAEAVRLGGGSALAAPILRIAGSLTPASASHVEGAIETGATVAIDPFATIPLPALDAAAAGAIAHAEGSTTFVAPGVHGALEFASGKVVLEPGLHQFAGGIVLSGTAQLELDRATIQLDQGAAIDVADAASIAGTPASGIGTWSGFSVIQRSPLMVWRIATGARIDLDGVLYAPQTRINASGTTHLVLDAAVIRRYRGSESASLVLESKVEALDLPVVAGRARLVR